MPYAKGYVQLVEQTEPFQDLLEGITTELSDLRTELDQLKTEVRADLEGLKTVQEETTAAVNAIATRLESSFDVIVADHKKRLYGASTDEKPTDGIEAGSTFYEYDTQDIYMFTGEEWLVQ